MANFDTSTPQSKVVKGMTDAIASRDLNSAEPIISRDFIMKMFPKLAGLPDLTKEEYLQKYGVIFALFAKIEITFHEMIEAPARSVFHLTLLFTTPDGTTVDYDSLFILSFINEDGELKVLEAKLFPDTEKRGKFHAEVTKLLAKGTPVA